MSFFSKNEQKNHIFPWKDTPKLSFRIPKEKMKIFFPFRDLLLILISTNFPQKWPKTAEFDLLLDFYPYFTLW